jgi:2,3-dihydroxy-p-cumate/2,3-dihydroxybenzoate 3,4-dioxygenase
MIAPPFRFRRLGYVALNVTDIDRSLAFYRDLVGLQPSEIGVETAALRCGRDHHSLLLCRASEPGLKRIAFELESERDLAAAEAHLAARGLAPEAVDERATAALAIGRAIRFREPASRLCVELYARMRHMALPYEPRLANIQRLGHVVVQVRQFDAVRAFFTDVLGFRVSDDVTGFAAFLRCFPNPLHHSLAVIAGSEDRLHHVNFMVSDIDDVGRAHNRLRKAQVEIVFGPGRHLPSESIFLYFLDPDRMTVEYSFGMEEFPEVGAREPRLLEARPEALDTWGGLPAPAFAKVGRIEAGP